MIFLILILVSFVFLLCYSKKRANPYQLFLIFGKKGSGKSTLMIKWMIKDLKRGWNVYTDIPGIKIPSVRFINTNDLATFSPPPGSAVYLDEVGLSFDNRNFKNFPTGLRDLFALQRHYKLKIVCASQSFDVDKKIRDRTDRLYLQTNILNLIGITRPIHRSVTLTEASSEGESRIADQLKFGWIGSFRFTWLPAWSEYFNSFDAPDRDEIPFTSFDDMPPKKALRRLNRAFKKR